jgi:preprotein translocase subunit SecD
VLLGGLQSSERASGAERYLLGPSEMKLNSANVSSVVAQKTRQGQWIVKIHLTPTAAATWDRVARESFHQFLAIDMNGVVVSAPIIQPTYASFKSFKGSLEVSGQITAANARDLAAAVK